MFFDQTSTRPPTHAPKAYQTWKENNQLPTKCHKELKDNSIAPTGKHMYSRMVGSKYSVHPGNPPL